MNHYSKKRRDPLPYSCPDSNSYTYVDGLGFTPPPPVVTERRLLQWYSNGIGFAVLFTIIFSFTMPYVVLGIVEIFHPAIRLYGNQLVASPALIQLIDMISGHLAMLLPFVLFAFLCKAPFSVVLPFRSFCSSVAAPGLFIAMGVSVIGLFASQLLSLFMSFLGFSPILPDITFPDTPAAAMLYLLNLTLFGPLVEEMVFRGIVMNTLRRFGDSFALLISSLLFAFIHMNLTQMPNAFLMGLVMGYFVLCTGSLWVGVLIHAVNNSLVLLLNGVLYSVPQSASVMVMLSVFSLYLIGGIIALLYLVRRHPNMFIFLRSSTLSIERKKYIVFFSAMTMVICLIFLGIFTLSNISAVSY